MCPEAALNRFIPPPGIDESEKLSAVVCQPSAATIRNQSLLPKANSRVELEVHRDDLPRTAREIAPLLASQPMLFDRGGPARLVYDEQRGKMVSTLLSVAGVINEIHDVARPWWWVKSSGGSFEQKFITMLDKVAKLYLDPRGNWGLRLLNGITTTPLLTEDGGIQAVDGYNPGSGMFCERMPKVSVPDHPTEQEAQAALLLIRETLSTFAFADSGRVFDGGLGVHVVDLTQPAKRDESAALVGLMTSVCRHSLQLAPGLMVDAPTVSGAGTGKGLLVRVICGVANGTPPRAMTAGGSREEMDKRITAALIEADPVLFLDNVNGITLKSDVLASAITECPAAVRPLGVSRTVLLNPTAFIAVTGNGLVLSEDLIRRFVVVELDAGIEDPESRPFKGDLVNEVLGRRGILLQAVLTIWRWGRQNVAILKPGKPLGSFETWGRWCRDPLLALGCEDPVARVSQAKADDPRRRAIAELFACWWEYHHDRPVTIAGLACAVCNLADPQNRGRGARQRK